MVKIYRTPQSKILATPSPVIKNHDSTTPIPFEEVTVHSVYI